MARIADSELAELVDAPNESLSVEYKDWLDLGETRHRAALARHIAALANHGGGHIVFGFDDKTMQPTEPNRKPPTGYDHDVVSGIVKKYLEPPFQCGVHVLTSTLGIQHPIIEVPGHGATPICTKASGPDGEPGCVAKDIYYVRKPGPESAPILTASEWAPIIRRCVMHERSSILGAIDAALRGGGLTSTTVADRLKTWHDAAHKVFLKDAAERGVRPLFAKAHYQFSYLIGRADGQELDHGEFIDVLRRVNNEVRDLVSTGWSMLYPFTRPGIAPYFASDPESGLGERDFVQTSLMTDTQSDTGPSHPDMWRAAPSGEVTLIRDYWEDDEDWSRQLSRPPGSWLSPNMLVRNLAEIVRHARALAERYTEPTEVSFRCEWFGLEGRELFDPQALWLHNRVARDDRRLVTGTWSVATLVDGWPDVVSHLGSPVMRAFAPDFALTAEWIRGQAPRWRS